MEWLLADLADVHIPQVIVHSQRNRSEPTGKLHCSCALALLGMYSYSLRSESVRECKCGLFYLVQFDSLPLHQQA